MKRLPRTLYAVPQTLHVHLEIAKAVQMLAVPEERQQLSPPVEAAPPDVDTELIKRCANEISREILPLVRSFLGNGLLSKAAVDDPKHPGWPAHTPDSKGGEFRPKDAEFDSTAPNAPVIDGRLAMEPTDPVTGMHFSFETPANRFGGGEGAAAVDLASVPVAAHPKRPPLTCRARVHRKSVRSRSPII
jgi:hypothetical protein